MRRMEPSTLFGRVTTHLDRAAGELEYRLLHAVRSLVWVIATIAFALLAVAFSTAALIVSLWDTQHLLPLIVPAVTCALLALLFGFFAARTLRERPLATIIGTGARAPPATAGQELGSPPPGLLRRGHPLAWIMAALGLLYLGPSREFLALAVRTRGLVALLAHAAHVVHFFARKRVRGVRAS
jgi:uncharacterized membrane protein YqjE